MPRWLKLRNGLYSYYRRVPKAFADVDSRAFAEEALGTRDLRRAEKLVHLVNREQEKLWVALKKGGAEDARERYLGAIERARLEGFEYQPTGEIAAGELSELLARLERLEALYPDIAEAGDDAPSSGERAAVAALLGTAKMPELTLSAALQEYETLARSELHRKSPDQMRRWRAPRMKAFGNLIALVGDKAVSSIARADAVALRAWWVERIVEEGLAPNSANKDIGHLSQILGTLDETYELGIGRPFARLRLKEGEEQPRAPFPIDHLVMMVTEPRHLGGLNEEARDILLVMVETGMRPIEICGLGRDDIQLDAEVPHVLVRAVDRDLKTPYSKREIPLVGISLVALRRHPDGFPRYKDKSAGLSSDVNKMLRSRGLLPTEKHSLYSIRHTFQDRLVAADMPDRMQADLMGHKFARPLYGEGPTLAHKREWLLRLAITAHPEPPDPSQGRLF
ncbi:DUF6538 domain-containing protein [Afifella aestuarii]|uniref:DUF6538 domain-containing protein n=1 Tax=Afifella aestuarii TaxID=1909496 RepID=UPI000FE2A637|nr:tyrosine-type recombinase/integrase [Afifella aestuarii]